MRLLNVRTLQISTFYNQQTRPAYAIFSHMWGEEEVTFDDIKNLGRARALKGFRKIEFCCRTAEERGLDWVWIDTCSIDKSSSAELSEAINSMFEWYGCAKECYAYLEDLPGLQNTDECGVSESQNFAQSRWFTRGWTLQELISPRELRFYDRNWNFFATRFDMAATLSKITSIDESIFHVKHDFRAQFSIAQRMSWASRRETTREEDMAYCLMGLFDVNMPLLYGEGVSKSFLRLQEEILKRSEDHSIFLWNPHSHLTSSGLLACSARDFTSSGCYVSTGTYRHKHEMTNLGLRITLPTILFDPSDSTRGYIGIINSRTIIDADDGDDNGDPTTCTISVQELGPERDNGPRIGIVLQEDADKGVEHRLLRDTTQPLLKLNYFYDHEIGDYVALVVGSYAGSSTPREYQTTVIKSIHIRQVKKEY